MVRAEVHQSAKHVKAVYEYCTSDKAKHIAKLVVDAVFILVSIVLIIIGLPKINDSKTYMALALCGFGLFVVCLFAMLIIVVSRSKTLKERDEIPTDPHSQFFFFDDDAFYIDYDDGTEKTSFKIEYFEVLSALESPEFFFISYEVYSYRAIAKKEFISGTPEELRELLTQTLGERFKVRN